jgi:hypothetical protein
MPRKPDSVVPVYGCEVLYVECLEVVDGFFKLSRVGWRLFLRGRGWPECPILPRILTAESDYGPILLPD